jgi:hypothetical protein
MLHRQSYTTYIYHFTFVSLSCMFGFVRIAYHVWLGDTTAGTCLQGHKVFFRTTIGPEGGPDRQTDNGGQGSEPPSDKNSITPGRMRRPGPWHHHTRAQTADRQADRQTGSRGEGDGDGAGWAGLRLGLQCSAVQCSTNSNPGPRPQGQEGGGTTLPMIPQQRLVCPARATKFWLQTDPSRPVPPLGPPSPTSQPRLDLPPTIPDGKRDGRHALREGDQTREVSSTCFGQGKGGRAHCHHQPSEVGDR